MGDELFRLMVECVTDYAIFLLDPEGRISTWNPGARRLKGWEAGEIIGRHFSAFYPAEDVAAGKPDRELVEAAAVGRFEDEGWRLRKDGSRFWANVVITALRDRGGALRGFGKVTRDLTPRKEAEEAERRAAADRARAAAELRAAAALRESEEQFRALADSIPQLAWIAAPDGEIGWYNRRWYEYTGTGFEEMRGWGWQAVHDPADLPRVLRSWRDALASGVPWEDEFRLRRHDGALRWHLSRARPVRDAQGRIARWVGTNTDIEEQRRAMADLRRAEEEARETGRLQERLVAIVGHDLRTPLSVIHLGVSSMLQRGGLSPEHEKTLVRVSRSAQRMRGIIDDLLDFSRARQGLGIPVTKEAVDLAELCRRAVAELGPLSRGRTLSLAAQGDTTLAADPARLLQVVANLVGNAVQHGTGPVSLEVIGAGEEVVLAVGNEGPPIPPEVLPQLFEPFRRGEGHAVARGGSVGLGLFIVREVVRAHGGEVEARSDAAATVFTVRLPRGGGEGARAERPGEGAPASS